MKQPNKKKRNLFSELMEGLDAMKARRLSNIEKTALPPLSGPVHKNGRQTAKTAHHHSIVQNKSKSS